MGLEVPAFVRHFRPVEMLLMGVAPLSKVGDAPCGDLSPSFVFEDDRLKHSTRQERSDAQVRSHYPNLRL